MSDLSAYGSSIQGLKEQAQSCRVGRSSPPQPPTPLICPLHAAFDHHLIRLILDNAVIRLIITLLLDGYCHQTVTRLIITHIRWLL